MKPWTKILPFFFVQWYAKRYMQTNTLGGRSGVWVFRDTFFIRPRSVEKAEKLTAPQQDAPFGLFAGENFYAFGGMQDFKGRFATVDDARAALPKYEDSSTGKMERVHDWYQIVHLPTMNIVESEGLLPET